MRFAGKTILLVGLIVGMAFSAGAAQTHSSSQRKTMHKQERHKSGTPNMPDPSKKMNADLTKLENQEAKVHKSGRPNTGKNATPAFKASKEDHQSNPPMNFGNSTKKGSATRSGGNSKSQASSVRMGRVH